MVRRFAAALLLAQARAAARHFSVYDGPMPPVYGESEANAAFMRRWVTENAKVPKRESDGNPWGDDEPACDLPAYDMGEWMASQGRRLPDHPAIFTAGPSTRMAGFEEIGDVE